ALERAGRALEGPDAALDRDHGVVDGTRRGEERAEKSLLAYAAVVLVGADSLHGRRRLAHVGVAAVDHVVDRPQERTEVALLVDTDDAGFKVAVRHGAADVARLPDRMCDPVDID